MLTSPLATTTNWTWNLAPATDLPKPLRGSFPSTADGPVPADTVTQPVVHPEALIGNSTVETALLFPFTGTAHHLVDAAAHWVWGSAADIAIHPALRTRLPYGNPLFVLKFNHVSTAGPDSFPSAGVVRGDPIKLISTAGILTEISVTDLTIIAAFPARPGTDTLGVLRFLRDALDAPAWTELVDAMDSLEQPLRVLEPSGRPVSGRDVTLQGPGFSQNIFLSSLDRGDVLSAGGIARADILAGSTVTLASDLEEIVGATDTAASQAGVISIASDTDHINMAALDSWFGPQGSSALQRYTRGNTVVPFVNGPAFFNDLFTELHNPPGVTPNDFYLTGYGINHTARFVAADLGVSSRTIADVATMVSDAGGEARFLALQFLQIEPDFVDDVETAAAVVAMLLAAGGITVLAVTDSEGWDQANFWGHINALNIGAMFGVTQLRDLIETLEPNRAVIAALAAIDGVEAHLDPYPQECADNPACDSSNAVVSQILQAQKRFGAFHQKIAIVRNGGGVHAYCGGIDMAPNRLDDRDHGRRGPYHDVHSRINGPAAGELALTFSERWRRAGTSTLAIDAPGALDGLPADGPDIVQIARTYFGPNNDDPSRALPFAPDGERTIIDTLIAAVRQARRYIYIEDQYLTPSGEFVRELLAAAARVSGPLIIVIPETPDQPFGFGPRQRLIEELTEAWGDRLKVGTMRQRFSRAQTNRKTATGRLWLVEDVSATAGAIKISPASRVPGFPFWLVVGGESMFATHSLPGVGDGVTVNVKRGGMTNLFDHDTGPSRAAHAAGNAVTAGSFPGVYVHAKVMLVDDVFASIGSANSNRRGYYSDGECNVFAMRESLDHGDNWIKALRLELWSELLGVTEEFAEVAFQDPVRHQALFDRKFFTGNRFSPFAAQQYATEAALKTQFLESTDIFGGLLFIGNLAAGMGLVLGGAESDKIFGAVVDPSSLLERP